MNYEIKDAEYSELVELYEAADLELNDDRSAPGTVIKNWQVIDENGRQIAGASLLEKEGLCVLEDLAVVEDLRREGLGKELLALEIDRAGEEKYEELWLCAKIPEYYLKFGWEDVDPLTAPPISMCQDCSKFHKSCFPRIMVKKL